MFSKPLPLALKAIATIEPKFQANAKPQATAERRLRGLLERFQSSRKRYSKVPKINAPAQWPRVLARIGP
jgi:hypothetical protein